MKCVQSQVFIQQLTADDFPPQTSDRGVFVRFFAPWSEHSQEMQPAWEALASAAETQDNAVLADVDCTAEKDLCRQHAVTGLPTLVFFTTLGSVHTFDGDRTLTAMTEAVERWSRPSCTSDHKDRCDAEQLRQLEDIEALGAEEVARRTVHTNAAIAADAAEYQEAVLAIQEQYAALTREHSAKRNEKNGALLLLNRATFGSCSSPP